MFDGLDEVIECVDGYVELDFSKGMLVLVNNYIILYVCIEFSDDEWQCCCLLCCWLSSEFICELLESFLLLFYQVVVGSLCGGICFFVQEFCL